MKNKFSIAMTLAVVLAMLLTSLALADNVVNDVTVGGSDTFTAGGSTTVSYKVVGTGGDGQTGCNASDGSSATVTINTPAEVTANPGSLSFTACNNFQSVTFSSTTPGDYSITVSVSDSGSGSYSTGPATFILHVQNPPPPTNTPPVITVPGPITAEGNTVGGANVTFTVTATDTEDNPDPTPTCDHASGSFFPLGTTQVSCSVTDSGGLSDSGLFDVTVIDTTAPSISDNADMNNVEGNTIGGANVSFSTPTATDIVDASPSVSCSANSGDFFPLGTTTVTCTATDGSDNSSSSSFDVTVVDTTAPTITCPANIVGTVGETVTLGSPTVSDIVDASLTVSNNAPASFGPGTTTVIWTALDDSGNSATCSQTVTLTYVFLGFFQPVDKLPTVNSAKAGQAIPFKWALKDANGNFVSDLSSVSSYGYGSLICGSGTTDTIESYDTTGTSGLRYDPIANQFIFTSQTQKTWAGSCKTFTLVLADGTKHQANFKFVK